MANANVPAETADALSRAVRGDRTGPNIPAPRRPASSGGYIKQNGCQNPKNRREVLADSKLRPVFGGAAKATMFEVPKHLNRHLT